MEFRAQLALQADSDVLHDRQVRKGRRNLEGADEAAARRDRRAPRGDVLALEMNGAGRRRQELGDQIENCRLAGAVRADQAWMVPRCTLRLTSETAVKPLNSLVRPRVSRMVSLMGSPDGTAPLLDE
jgi:hypothetical protein